MAEETSDVTIKIEFKKRESHHAKEEAPQVVRAEKTVFDGPTEGATEKKPQPQWSEESPPEKTTSLLPPAQVLDAKKDQEWS